MKKLNFLKAIVDFVWIMALITFPMIVVFAGYLIITKEPLEIPIKMNGVLIEISDFRSKILFVAIIIASGFLIYVLYLFKKLMEMFKNKIIFENIVIDNLNKIGIYLSIAAVLFGISGVFVNLLHNEMKLEIGLNSYVLLFALGLFFMVLSEVFKIAKNMKEENELTV